LDTETGEYNLAYIRQYLPELPVVVLSLVGRQQGLLLPKENPKGIRDLVDLTRHEIVLSTANAAREHVYCWITSRFDGD